MRPYRFLNILILIAIFCSPSLFAKTCSIYIHGFTSTPQDYFGKIKRQVHWDSNLKIEDAAPQVANGILEQSKTCEKNEPIVLRAHSYGAAVTFYILGMGRRYQMKFSEHSFTKVYKMTTEFYSYTGAYSGTTVMDLLCGSKFIRKITSYFGKKCVPSLTTNGQFHPAEQITNPGVPTYLVYSTNRDAYRGTVGAIIAMDGISWFKWLKGERNQNDSILPQHSTRGCARVQPMTDRVQNCTKISSQYFQDFYWEKDYSHNDFLENEDFMKMEVQR